MWAIMWSSFLCVVKRAGEGFRTDLILSGKKKTIEQPSNNWYFANTTQDFVSFTLSSLDLHHSEEWSLFLTVWILYPPLIFLIDALLHLLPSLLTLQYVCLHYWQGPYWAGCSNLYSVHKEVVGPPLVHKGIPVTHLILSAQCGELTSLISSV